MRNFELRIADQRVVLSVKWLQTRSRSRTHSSANPRANNTPNPRNILVDVTVRPKPVNNKQHSNHRTQQGRTEQVARAPPSARSPSVPRMRAPLGEAARRCPKPPRGANAPTAAPRNNPRRTTLPRTVTNMHSDSTGGVPPHPTLAGPRRASAPAVVAETTHEPRRCRASRDTRIPTSPVESRRASPRPPAPSGPETSTSVFV